MQKNGIYKLKQLTWFLILLAGITGQSLLQAQVTPWQMIKKMGRGINIGNTMEAPYEGQWQSPIQEFYFDDYVDAGFTTVRIPIRWENHMETVAPFTVDSLWLNRVEQVVDWSLERGLITIINSHHDRWLFENFPQNLPRFERLWEQIALRFKDKPPELLFEIINEPYFDLTRAQIDTINQTILKVIRQSNPQRIVIITGGGNDTSPRLTSYLVVKHLKVPDDPFVMAYFHYYKPWNFTNDEVENPTDTWGTAQDKAEVDAHFDMVNDWVDSMQVPMLLGEFGVDNVKPLEPRLEWYKYITSGAVKRGFAFTLWCAGPTSGKYTYLRQKGLWEFEQLNAITGQEPFAGAALNIPGVVQAEQFDLGGMRVAYLDADSLNQLQHYRPDEGVEIDSLGPEQFAVYFDQPGEWTEYSLRVDSSAYYAIRLRVATTIPDADVRLTFNNQTSLSFASLPLTGGLKSFTELQDTLFLDKGFQVLRVATESGGVSVDNITISVVASSLSENLLLNPGFEQGLLNWTPKQCNLTVVNKPVHSGEAALLVSERSKEWSGPFQNIKEQLLKNGPGKYIVSGFFKMVSDSGVQVKVKVRLDYGGQQHHIAALAFADTNGWTLAIDTLTLIWDEPLEDANLFLQTGFGATGSFYVDDLNLQLDSVITAIEAPFDGKSQRVNTYTLKSFPNPFNAVTTIIYNLPKPSSVLLQLFDVQGRVVQTIKDEKQSAGSHRLRFEAKHLSSGIYFLRLQAGPVERTRKIILLK